MVAYLFPLLLVYLSSHSGNEDSGGSYIFLIGPLVAVFFYKAVWFYYRNVDKRYNFEDSSGIKTTITDGEDYRIRTVRGSRKQELDGRNDGIPQWRIGQPRPQLLRRKTERQ